MTGIYQIQSRSKPDRIYVGSATNLNNRMSCHFKNLRKNIHDNSRLQNHFNKYGTSDLLFSVLVCCERYDLIKHEQLFIDLINPWFNISRTAGNSLGYKHTPESLEKMRGKRKGCITWMKGKHHTNEAKEANRIAHLGRKSSKEQCKKHSIAMMGKGNPRFGKHCSEETKQKIRDSKLKKIV